MRLSGDGSVLVIGEPNTVRDHVMSGDDEAIKWKGRGFVSIYNLRNNTWVQLGQTIEGESEDDGCGSAVAIANDGNVVAACAPKNNVNITGISANGQLLDPSVGSCRAYKYNSSLDSWQQLGFDIDGSSLYDFFGTSVSLDASGHVIAIGAVGSDINGDNSGYVRVLEYDDNNEMWHLIGNDIPGPFQFAGSGRSVALSAAGDIVTIGAPSKDMVYSGSARVYETGVQVPSGTVPLNVQIDTGGRPVEIGWSIERLDVERYEPAFVTVLSAGTYSIGDQTETMKLNVPMGGVYRFLIQPLDEVVDFSVEVDGQYLGIPVNASSYVQYSFMTPPLNDERNGTRLGTAFITLLIDFDDHPEDIHWVMQKSDISFDSNGKQLVNHRTVLAFGPESEYPSTLSGKQHVESIDVSSLNSESSLTFILTDDGRDGMCCDHGTGLIRVYNGTSSKIESNLLFESTATGMRRFVKTFHL